MWRSAFIAVILLFLCQANSWADVQDIPISVEDARHAEKALYYLRNGKMSLASQERHRVRQPALRNLINWRWFWTKDGDASPEDILAFVRKYPDWPDLDTLKIRAEEALIKDVYRPRKEVLAFFREHPPITAEGKLYLAEEMLSAGEVKPEAVKKLKEAWVDIDVDRSRLKALEEKYSQFLTKEVWIDRIERLLWDNKVTAAGWSFKHAPLSYQRLFEARSALQRSARHVDRAVDAVPKELQRNPGLLYDRIRWRERKGREDSALELLLTVKGNASKNPKWWSMRKRLSRTLLEEKRYKDAYKLVTAYAGTPGSIEFAENQWLAGWLATRFLHKPREGYEHFFQMHKNVSTPISLARSAYWAACAAEANGNPKIAKKWYEIAAKHVASFYGQLALTKLKGKPSLEVPVMPEPTVADKKAYEQSSLVRTAHALMVMGEERLARDFILQAIRTAKTPGMKVLIADIGQKSDDQSISVYAAREAMSDGVLLVRQGYPTLPHDYNMAVDRALVHAIALQESRFDTDIGSHAGAKGLMQLLPSTARRIAHKLRLHWHRSRLVTDPAYNVRIGSAYIHNLLMRYDDELVLAIAAYNAGPGNVKKWIKAYGDPRKFKDLDKVVDWIELIPFSETRNYVQRVIENMQLYHRLFGQKRLSIKQDLLRMEKS